METHFTLEQLRDPRLKEADDILRRCVHCGFCIATCPTYLLLGDERDSPRGRIYLIKAMLEGNAAPKQIRPHLDRCLSCCSCMTTCPSGVDYMHLSDYARQLIEKSSMRAPNDEFDPEALAQRAPLSEAVQACTFDAGGDPTLSEGAQPLALEPHQDDSGRRAQKPSQDRDLYFSPNGEDHEAEARARGLVERMRSTCAQPPDQRRHCPVPQPSRL